VGPVLTVLPNGLALHRIRLQGTRALTVLIAFEAGGRTKRREENGIAHFLEHLAVKGGLLYADHRRINQTAEGIGAHLDAYTGPNLVAFHITARAEPEVVETAIDLVTDFVARPRLDPSDLERERGVVIQEMARANDQPAWVADALIGRAGGSRSGWRARPDRARAAGPAR
jgi:predicted Zn-dependent peptidase